MTIRGSSLGVAFSGLASGRESAVWRGIQGPRSR